MNTILRFVLAGLALGFAFTAPVLAADDARSIKQVMGENFQNVHKILNDLITSNYVTLPKDVAAIHNHAEALAKRPPAGISSREERDLFVSYATNLRVAASHLITVSEELIRRDEKPAAPGALKIDYLRVVAAEHYGAMITSCALCHNQFRRYIVSMAGR